MNLLIEGVIPLLLLLGLTFHYLFLYSEAVDIANVTLLGQSEEDVDFVIMFAYGASYPSVKLGPYEFVNPYELSLLDPV